MLKKSVLFFCFSMAVLGVFAQKVSIDEAATIAANIYTRQAPAAEKGKLTDLTAKLVHTEVNSNETCYYVFDMNAGGWVVVSACKAVPPVLAYAFNGSYKTNEFSPAALHLLQDYAGQIALAVSNAYMASPEVLQQWNSFSLPPFAKEKGSKAVNPLLFSTWDQGKYYNEFCPVDSGGPDRHAWAGCVPTAMGQIMNYWHWPAQGVSSYSYLHPVYGNQTADFANTTYHWNEMPLSLNGYNTPVAELLYHLGVSVDLDYGPDGSGMYNHKAAYALRTYFGYSPLTQYIFRDTATHTNWKGLVLTHLDNHIPLYYAGWADTINVSGHAFVCDGYQDTTWFHMNFGWSGSDDGYYMLDDLTPSVFDFTLDHELILNIVPDGAYPAGCSGIDTLTAMGGNFGDGSGPVNNYVNNADCYWLIAPEDSVTSIKLTFKTFDVAGPGDKVIVYNGNTTAAPVLGTFTGTSLPSQLTANGQYMLVHFISDTGVNAAGWLAAYTTTTPVYCSGITNLTAQSGDFNDGSGPRDYHNGSLCRWSIQPAGATSIALHINSLDLGIGDFIEVYDQIGGAVLARLTGDSIPAQDIQCFSPKMLVMLKSDGKYTADGFSAHYYVSSGIEELKETAGVSVYPVPADHSFVVSGTLLSGDHLSMQLFNASSALIWDRSLEQKAGSFSYSFASDDLPEGLYLLRIVTQNEQQIQRIIINH
jgi:hypothetical protein